MRMEASEARTVAAENATALPAVATVSATAATEAARSPGRPDGARAPRGT